MRRLYFFLYITFVRSQRGLKAENDRISFRWGSESIPEEVHERQQQELPPEYTRYFEHPRILNLEALRDKLRRAQGDDMWIYCGLFVLSFLIAGQAFGIFLYLRNH